MAERVANPEMVKKNKEDIEALGNKLTVDSFTVTAGQNVTIGVQNCYIFNKVAFFNMFITTSTALANGSILFSLPSGYTFKKRVDYHLHNGKAIWGSQNGDAIGTNTGSGVTLEAGTYILSFCALMN